MKTTPTKSKRRGRSKCKQNTILGIAMVTAVAVSFLFAIAPGLDKQRAQDQQTELLKSIIQGDGVITLDSRFAAEPVDFYDDSNETEEVTITPEPVPLTTTGTESVTTEPTPPPASANADSTVITGVGILTIDKINLRLPVVDGVSNAQLKVAVGRVPETAEIGAIGNAVIAGHRNYTYGQMFNRLGELENGDVIEYRSRSKDGATKRFAVYDISEIRPGDQSAFEQPSDFSEITLYTCTPIKTATHRLLVRARLID